MAQHTRIIMRDREGKQYADIQLRHFTPVEVEACIQKSAPFGFFDVLSEILKASSKAGAAPSRSDPDDTVTIDWIGIGVRWVTAGPYETVSGDLKIDWYWR